jgi:hypothetical protein
MVALGRHKRGRKIRLEGESATTRSDVGSKRSFGGRVAIHTTENISLSQP